MAQDVSISRCSDSLKFGFLFDSGASETGI